MKKIFAILFSFQLILSPVVFAQGQNAGLKDAYLETGTGSQGGLDFYTNQVIALVVSTIGSSIVSQCLEGVKNPSIATFMAGSLVHMGSEILGAKAKNERHKKKKKDLEIQESELKKEGDVSQKAILDQALLEEKETRDFITNRKNWMIAITTIYSAAAALAIIEEVNGLIAGFGAATPLCTSETSSCTVAMAACEAACIANYGSSQAIAELSFATDKAKSVGLSSCTKVPTYTNSCQKGIEAYFGVVVGACKMQPVDGGASFFSWQKLLTMAYGFGMGKVGAGGGQISQYGTMLIGLLSTLTTTFSKTVVAAYNFPLPRATTFGAAAVFSGVITDGLAKREEIAKKNIKKLETVIDNFKVTTAGETAGIGLDSGAGGGDYGAGDPNDPKYKNSNIKTLANIKAARTCLSNSSKGWEASEGACSRSFKPARPSLSNVSFPALRNVAGLSSDMAQAVADGDVSKAGKIAGEIGAYAAKVREEAKKVQASYNEMQKKNKKPTKDFDAEVKQQVASLQAELNKAAASQNMNLANLGEPLPAEEKKSDESVKASKVSSEDGAAAPAADPLAGLGMSEEVPPVDEGALVESSPEQNLSDFETNEQDISKKNDVSLFKQLSNRYILNYTKIFERKKEPEATQTQEPPKK